MRVFMLNGLVIGLAGTAIGIPLGYAICWAIQTWFTLPGDVYLLSRIPVNIKFFDVALVGRIVGRLPRRGVRDHPRNVRAHAGDDVITEEGVTPTIALVD